MITQVVPSSGVFVFQYRNRAIKEPASDISCSGIKLSHFNLAGRGKQYQSSLNPPFLGSCSYQLIRSNLHRIGDNNRFSFSISKFYYEIRFNHCRRSLRIKLANSVFYCIPLFNLLLSASRISSL